MSTPTTWPRRYVERRRTRYRIPQGEAHRPGWRPALEMLDELSTRDPTTPDAETTAGYGDNAPWARPLRASTFRSDSGRSRRTRVCRRSRC
ncbi:hypothetical protein [Streptacidiphilus sp. EB129]|uniref:hypothetical protein n=1 Tax=Streptacidiphilus sp. EB129 TaxID=3156262 RepID=UPI0035191B0F